MIYTELITIILGISLILYLLLGGADFGAGIVELFIGDKSNSTVSRAIGPVWEANHIWLIIAVVILFNGFPQVYATFSTALHIPILIVLLGIIFRGAAFTFRHYDAIKDDSQHIYSAIFRYSSILTVMFLGITVGAIISGNIPPNYEGGFVAYFIAPWANLFSLAIGIFLTTLVTYIAAIFLLGEVTTDQEYMKLAGFTRKLFIAAVVSGVLIFGVSWMKKMHFHAHFLESNLSIAAGLITSSLVPFIFAAIKKRQIWKTRILVGAQLSLILIGWFVIQWPDFMLFNDGTQLTIYDTAAPLATMKVLFWALIFGICSIFPALYYLFRIFKLKDVND